MMAGPENHTYPISVGPSIESTMLELATRVIALTGLSSHVVFRLLPQDDPVQRQPDFTLAKEDLERDAETLPDEGLERTIEYSKGL